MVILDSTSFYHVLYILVDLTIFNHTWWYSVGYCRSCSQIFFSSMCEKIAWRRDHSICIAGLAARFIMWCYPRHCTRVSVKWLIYVAGRSCYLLCSMNSASVISGTVNWLALHSTTMMPSSLPYFSAERQKICTHKHTTVGVASWSLHLY